MTDLEGAIRGWAPEPVTTTGTTTAWAVAAASGIFDLDPVAGPGEDLPPMWHWFGFLENPRSDELADDGHVEEGHFLPPMPERRRMFAGGRLRIHRPMRVGETLRRTSSLVDARVKRGRSGEMLLVTVRDQFHDGDGTEVVVDESDLVYRSQAPGQARGIGFDTPSADVPPGSADAVTLHPDETLLFRVSALTYNSHRIHYDHPYATAVEGYPGLVVHGPLLALMLLEIPRRHRPGLAVTAIDYRLTRPAFAGAALVADHDGPPGTTELALTAGAAGLPASVFGTITLA